MLSNKSGVQNYVNRACQRHRRKQRENMSVLAGPWVVRSSKSLSPTLYFSLLSKSSTINKYCFTAFKVKKNFLKFFLFYQKMCFEVK